MLWFPWGAERGQSHAGTSIHGNTHTLQKIQCIPVRASQLISLWSLCETLFIFQEAVVYQCYYSFYNK